MVLYARKYIKYAFMIFAAIICLVCRPVWAADTEYVMIIVNDLRVDFGDTEPEAVNYRTYAPIRSFSDSLGADVTWDNSAYAATLKKDDTVITVLPNASVPVRVNGVAVSGIECYFKNERLMLPYRFIAETFGYEVEYFDAYNIARVTDGTQKLSHVKILEEYGETALAERERFGKAVNPLRQGEIVVGDGTRMAYENVEHSGSLYLVGNVGFEDMYITKEGAAAYSAIINDIAASVPSARTYSVLVPSASEFYAPKELYRNQLEGINLVYDRYSSDITPIDAYRPLYEHSYEKLYFMTDHHWTQRAAYYAYEAFLKQAGGTIDPLDSFEKHDSYDFVGYWKSYLSALSSQRSMLNKVSNNPELLERFMPKIYSEGVIYADGYMKKFYRNVQVVDPTITAYRTFAGGDNTLTVFVTSAGTGRKICIIKDSYGDAFTTWAINNYSEVYVIDPRYNNNQFGSLSGELKIDKFYEMTQFDDLVFVNYPGSVESVGYRYALGQLIP